MPELISPVKTICSEDLKLPQGGPGSNHVYPPLVSEGLRNSAVFKRSVKEFGNTLAAEIFSYLNNVFHDYGYREGGSRNGHDFEEVVRSLLETLGIKFVPNVRAGKSEVDFLIFGPRETILLEVKLAIRDNYDWQVTRGEDLSRKIGYRYVPAIGIRDVATALASVI